MVYTRNKTRYLSKEGHTSTPRKDMGSHNAEWKKLDVKEYMLFDSTDREFKDKGQSLYSVRKQEVGYVSGGADW